jgi:hypothetical protein
MREGGITEQLHGTINPIGACRMESSVPRALAILLTVMTVPLGAYLPSLKWEEQAFFDILGILWLLTNLPNLFLWGLFLLMLTLTLSCWALAIFHNPRRREDEILGRFLLETGRHGERANIPLDEGSPAAETPGRTPEPTKIGGGTTP